MKSTRKKTDFLFNKTLGVFGLAILGILALVGAAHMASTTAGYLAMLTIAWVLVALGAAGLAAAIVWQKRDAGKETEELRYFTGVDLGVISLLVLFSGALYCLFDIMSVTQMLYVLFPACAVLYLIFSLMPRIFFLQALLCGASLIDMWVVSNAVAARVQIVFSLLGILLSAAFATFFAMLRHGDGLIRFGGHKGLRVVEAREEYGAAFLSVLVTALLFVAAIVFSAAGIAAAPVLLYILCGYLFILAVYYTVKLM